MAFRDGFDHIRWGVGLESFLGGQVVQGQGYPNWVYEEIPLYKIINVFDQTARVTYCYYCAKIEGQVHTVIYNDTATEDQDEPILLEFEFIIQITGRVYGKNIFALL